MSVDDDKSPWDIIYNLRDWVARAKLGISALIALFIYIGMNYLFPLPDPGASEPLNWPLLRTPSSGWLEFRTALGAALIPFFAFGAVLQILYYKNPDSEAANALRRAIASSVHIISKFSGAHKRDFVRNSLEALLGNNIGPSTYDFIKPMLKDDAGFRTDFEYNVFISDEPMHSVTGAISKRFSNKRYRWIREDLTYKLHNPVKMGAETFSRGPFRVLFLFDKTSLELLNPDQSVFARFLIEFEENDLNWLLEQDEAIAIQTFLEMFGPAFSEKSDDSARKLELLDTVVTLEPAVKDPNKRTKRYFKIEMKAPLSAPSGKSSLKIDFSYPYRRSASHFIFTMPQPVFSPTLSFNYHYATSLVDVDYSSYYSVADPAKSETKHPKAGDPSYVFKVNGSWVFPTSGITMVWKNRDEAEA